MPLALVSIVIGLRSDQSSFHHAFAAPGQAASPNARQRSKGRSRRQFVAADHVFIMSELAPQAESEAREARRRCRLLDQRHAEIERAVQMVEHLHARADSNAGKVE